MTFDALNTEVNGLQGILDSYKTTIQKVNLSYPNKISPVIKEATEIATVDFRENKNYTILVIFTDLHFEDLWDAIDEVVEASDAPFSVIIVSVWNANEFDIKKLMKSGLVSSTGMPMKRDVVLYASYYHFINIEEQRLEMELMRKVPQQLHQYCMQHGFVPKMDECNDFI